MYLKAFPLELLTKVHIVKILVFLVVRYGKLSATELMLLNWAGEDS